MFNKVLITSGPTLEPIDPVRFISNRSSGKTGYYLAYEARQRHIPRITFISGPACTLPGGVDLIRIETAQELQRAVAEHAVDADVVIMAAAVSDYRSVKYYPEKLKKSAATFNLQLVKNPDILRELGEKKRKRQLLVGFAAETENIFENALKKFQSKNLDLLILNEISEQNPAFAAEENQVYFINRDGVSRLEKMSKARLAGRIWDEIFRLAGAD